MSEKIQPKVRFFGFTDAWEQCKLKNVAKITMGQSPSSKNYTTNPNDTILVQGNADIKNGWVVPRVWTTQITKKAKQGSLILSVRAPVGKIGKTKYDIVLGRGVAGISGNEFLFQYFKKMNSQGYWTRYSTGSTFESINSQDISNAYLQIPTVDEQVKVGKLLKTIDSLIAANQSKLEELKTVKKLAMQKIFDQEWRFKGFTDPWEQRKLGEVADIIGGGTPSTNVSEYWNGDIDWYSPVEIGNQIYIDESQKKITGLGLQKSSAHILPVGTVLFTSRAGIGNTAILAKEGCTNQGFQSIVPYKDLLNSYFIFSRTSELKRYGEINGAGSTFIEVSGKQMAKMPISVPSIEEQQKIGTFFKQLDDTITLHQQKCDQLKKIKKWCMQNLFV